MARGRELQVVGGVYHRAVGAQVLETVPYALHGAGMQEYFGAVNHHHGVLGRVEHGRAVVEHGALAVREAGGTDGVVAVVAAKPHIARVDQDAVAGEDLAPEGDEAVHPCRRQGAGLVVAAVKAELEAEEAGKLV